MRLVHFSDLHLGVDNYGSIDPRTGLSNRVADFLKSLDHIVDDAISTPCDAVLFSGDAFKNRDPSPTLQREFARRIVRLATAGIPIVLLVGNHDLPNVATRATPVEIYQVLSIPGVHVCRRISRVDIPTASGLLQIVAVPWVTRSMLLTADVYRDMSDTEIDREMARLISAAVAELASELDPDSPAVLMAHVSLQGASLGFEQAIMLGRDVTVGLDDLRSRAFDYVALGHIHKHQQVGVVPPAVYAGSPERIDFGEEREAKGYVRVDIESSNGSSRSATWTFVELPARRFRTIRVTADGDDPLARVMSAIAHEAESISDAIVRCFVYVDRGRERSIDSREVRRALLEANAAHVAHIVIESDTIARGRDELDGARARDSMKMLEHWTEQQDYDEPLRLRVLDKGRELIQRRTIDRRGREQERG
ncbi:MAG TPA: exonuclease SbcCD subunit D [Thermomicrobiales bacterium]|nr:exonuclease SbcCD subunit D [Thermomicrobiales bacterium]